MSSKRTDRIKHRLEMREKYLEELEKAYLALLSGQVQSYSIGSRSLTKFDLKDLKGQIDELEKEIDNLESQLQNGGKSRKAFGILPRDW